jgi:hypothetical protein
MVPAEFVASAVSMTTDALTQPHHFRKEVLSCQRCEIVIYHVFSLAQGDQWPGLIRRALLPK